MFAHKEMKNSFEEFLPLWHMRPIKPNPGGMELNHSWALWFTLKKLKPKVVVESGTFRGHSTWLIEQTLPDALIYTFDVDLSQRRFVSKNVTYREHDLVNFDWSALDKEHSVVFLDDHQDALQRMKDLSWLGFKRIIFEDNYPGGSGDFYDLNTLQSGQKYPPEREEPSIGRPFTLRQQLGRGLRSRGWRRIEEIPDTKYSKHNMHWVNARPRIKVLQEFPTIQLSNECKAKYFSLSAGGHLPLELLPDIDLTGEDLSFNGFTYVELY